MSNKNLKVYRIEFITEVQDMHFKVKFPCQVKMIWKRSTANIIMQVTKQQKLL